MTAAKASMPIERRKLYLRMQEMFAAVARRNRFVANAYGSELSLAAMHMLVEIDGSTGIQAAELAARLRLEKSTISRNLQRLERRGLITKKGTEHDRRLQLLLLSPKGVKQLRQADETANALLEQLCLPLGSQEQARLLEFITALADGLGVGPTALRECDHFLRPAIRRATRAVGLLGEDGLHGAGLSTLRWQVLLLIAGGRATSATALCRELQVAANTMSVALRTLERLKWIVRQVSNTDRRSFALALSKLGCRKLAQFEERLSAQLHQVFAGHSFEDLEEFIRLLAMLSGTASGSGLVQLQPHIEVRKLDTPEDLRQGRGVLVTYLVSQGRQWSLPERLLGADSRCFGVFVNGKLEGMAEFSGGITSPELQSVALLPPVEGLREEFLRGCWELQQLH